MDKNWMSRPKFTPEYISGIQNFIEFAKNSLDSRGMMLCPCRSCYNTLFLTPTEVRHHLIAKGMSPGYVVWNRHGEQRQEFPETEPRITGVTVNVQSNFGVDESMEDLIQERIGQSSFQEDVEEFDTEVADVPETEQHNCEQANTDGVEKLVQQADEELYPGCKKFSKLSFVLHLYQLKCLNSWSSTSFDMLLELLIDAFPIGALLPRNTYEVKKLMKEFDLGYNKIDACPNDCMLFLGDMSEKVACQKCGALRYLSDDRNSEKRVMKKPAKIVRYFPLIPRLRQLFKTEQSALDMTWHDTLRQKDGLLRHPADGEAWKSFDARHIDFSIDSRNVRLGLVSDGFNPFKTLSSTYSVWPIVLVVYNLPPWIGMNQNSFLLSTIIPGEKSPGNDIDIYMQPLIHELQQLWNGVSCFDASVNQNFNLRAALMWTINDFPAYAMLSGWSTKGRYACPCCAKRTSSTWLRSGKKFAYMGHRRWLPADHTFRQKKRNFDGTEEIRSAPTRHSGINVLEEVENMDFQMGKGLMGKNKGKGKKRALEEADSDVSIWKKKVYSLIFPTGNIICCGIIWM